MTTKTTTSGKYTKLFLSIAVLTILAGASYKSLGYEYAEGYVSGWKAGEKSQKDLVFDAMDDAGSLGNHEEVTFWNGSGNRKMKYMFYRVPDSY